MNNEMTDYQIVRAILEGDKDMFSHLVLRYKNLVFSIILRMINDVEEANDLSQEVFIKIYKNLDKYSPEYKLSTWIIRITTNHIIDYRRKKKNETVNIETLENELYMGDSPESSYIQKEQRQNLQNLVESLPEMYRIPIELYHNKGLSYQEIADFIQEPISKVKNRIFRGRKLLKASILSQGGN